MDDISSNILLAILDSFDPENSVSDICTKAGCKEEEFYERYDSLADAYSKCFTHFAGEATAQCESLPDWQEMRVEERIASFIFILLDVFTPHMDFVSETFEVAAAGYFSPFQSSLRSELSTLLVSNDVSGVSKVLFDNKPWRFVIAEWIVQLIGAWIKDDSKDKVRSVALIDRSVNLWSEIFSSPIPDRTVDLVRYSIESGYLPLKNWPFFKQWFDTEEEAEGA